MRNYPNALKRKLLDTICQMREELSKYTTDPKRDFTRNRKLPFETLCRTILSMSGQSLNVELQRQFHYDPTAATTSAFVQQREKLLPAAFEEILRRFTYQNRPIRRWNGYTLLAVDGSHVQIPSNNHDEATYFNSTKDGRGYNLLHLNALYDLESQLYLDAVIQDDREEHESRALVELVDRSELTEPVILTADRGYEAYNNMAHIEQKGWKWKASCNVCTSSKPSDFSEADRSVVFGEQFCCWRHSGFPRLFCPDSNFPAAKHFGD